MIIKTVTKDGNAVPLSPEEALGPAMKMAVATMNNSEFVYWLADKSVKAESFSSHPKDNGEYDALSEGTCMIGRTRIADDTFFVARPYRYKLHFCSCKDEIGAPHLKPESFEAQPAETNPANMVGEVDRTNTVAETFGEMQSKIQTTKVGGKQYGQQQNQNRRR